MKKLKSQKGSILVELALCSGLFVFLFFGTVEMFTLIQDSINVQKVAREVAREICIKGNTSIYKSVGKDASEQYFGDKNAVLVSYSKGAGYITVYTSYEHKYFSSLLSSDGKGSRILNGKATYPWWDQT